jgi:hypothetical protein
MLFGWYPWGAVDLRCRSLEHHIEISGGDQAEVLHLNSRPGQKIVRHELLGFVESDHVRLVPAIVPVVDVRAFDNFLSESQVREYCVELSKGDKVMRLFIVNNSDGLCFDVFTERTKQPDSGGIKNLLCRNPDRQSLRTPCRPKTPTARERSLNV